MQPNPTHNEPCIDQLCAAWLTAKRAEDLAKTQRIAIEGSLIQLVETQPDGAKTTRLKNYSVTTKTGTNVRVASGVDKKHGLQQLVDTLPAHLAPVKLELDATQAKFLRNNEPEAYAQIAHLIQTSSAKTSVSVKELEVARV